MEGASGGKGGDDLGTAATAQIAGDQPGQDHGNTLSKRGKRAQSGERRPEQAQGQARDEKSQGRVARIAPGQSGHPNH